jgi:hypothetical protein
VPPNKNNRKNKQNPGNPNKKQSLFDLVYQNIQKRRNPKKNAGNLNIKRERRNTNRK